jgi:tRNA(Ile)-lysidine synthase
MDLYLIVEKFLMRNANPEDTLLLGLSGGPDSMALFHILLQLQKLGRLKFAIAHINHNWRESSTHEAEALKLQALAANVTFHLLNLNPNELKGNLELVCRNERFKFFKKLCNDFSYKAAVLGHHLDDRAETVLKRLLEGATLPRLGALKAVTEIDGLSLLRPFLEVRKTEILKWLESSHYSYFHDITNQDPKFMRARFRTKIIPYLNQEFGKDVREPLNRIGLEALELDEYLSQHINIEKYGIVRGPFGSFLDFATIASRFEIKYVIRKFAEMNGFFLTYPLVDQASYYLETNAANKKMSIGNKNLFFDRKKMFIMSEFFIRLKNHIFPSFEIDTFNSGIYNCKPWLIEIRQNAICKRNKICWQDAFKGHVEYTLPAGKYHITEADLKDKFKGEISLNSLWSNHKVPAFLRSVMPVIRTFNKLEVEFLSGKSNSLKITDDAAATIIIQYIE